MRGRARRALRVARDAGGRLAEDHRPRSVLTKPVSRLGACLRAGPGGPGTRAGGRFSGCAHRLEPVERIFLLLPYMHSESREIHVVAERSFASSARGKPRLRVSAQGDYRPLRPLSASQRGARADLDARGNRVPQSAGLVVLKAAKPTACGTVRSHARTVLNFGAPVAAALPTAPPRVRLVPMRLLAVLCSAAIVAISARAMAEPRSYEVPPRTPTPRSRPS